jgi:uncharacterized protein with von Willebrand factor type A (vWA) domain
MKLTTGLHVRDAITKRQIYESRIFNSLSESDKGKLEALIEYAFRRGDAEWRRNVRSSDVIF